MRALKKVKSIVEEHGLIELIKRVFAVSKTITVSTLKQHFLQAAFKKHYTIEKLNSKKDIESFIARFREKYISCDLVRIGGEGDGGYLHPNNLKEIYYCFSPGVSFTADFEKQLSEEFNIKSFMADASVIRSPVLDSNFVFIRKFLGAQTTDEFITLSDWVNQTLGEDGKSKILQMDIEGGEYKVLIFEDASLLASFSTMTIEFHNLQKMFEKDFLSMISAIFEKIYKNFSICHVHPNNCCGIASLDGIDIPRVIEVTFIRNDLIKTLSNKDPIWLPHRLDRKNVENNNDIFMPEMWWKNKTHQSN